MEDAAVRFARARVPFPPIPADLVDRLRPLDDFLYSTREDGPRPYSIEWYVDELLAGPSVAPYSIVGHDGYGMNSWAIHFLLVQGPVAIFDQIAWGGAYGDDSFAVEVMQAHWTQLGDLIGAAASAVDRELLGADERYVVVSSDFHGARWWRGRPDEQPSWRHGPPLQVLVEAAIDAQELIESDNLG